MQLDVCTLCQLVWFDPGEIDRLPHAPPPEPPRVLPPEARRVVMEAELQRIDRQRKDEAWDQSPPDELWKLVPAVLGMPVETDSEGLNRLPILTWSLGALILAAAFLPADLSRGLAFVPAEPLRIGGLALLTSFFVHGGVTHLLGNLYFLLVFGDDVEDEIGRGRYLALLAAASVAGDVLHTAFTHHPTIPLIGASGGISGVLACYVVRFPRRRVGLFVWPTPRHYRWVNLPAWVAMVLWIGLQAFVVFEQLSGFGRVSGLGHLGGLLVGFAAGYAWRERS